MFVRDFGLHSSLIMSLSCFSIKIVLASWIMLGTVAAGDLLIIEFLLCAALQIHLL